jgi:hypothetical protein
VVAAATVRTVSPFTAPQWITVAHEMGHALNMPHSYSGLTFFPNTGAANRYDNPMDVMSGAYHTDQPVGTHAYNRYAAGWVDPARVRVHTEGIADYQLGAIGATGIAMVVLPTSDPGRFYVLDARRRTSYDIDLPTSGVEIHEIDTRRGTACTVPNEWPTTWPCFATLTRIKQHPAQAGIASTEHVLGIDDQIIIGQLTVSVTAATAGSFTIRVAGIDSGTFVDDDGLTAEPDIETIAALGITNGCNPPDNDRFCPDRNVTRGEMAAFLGRAFTYTDNGGGDWFIDDDDSVFENAIDRLRTAGVTQGCNPPINDRYCPDAFVTRGQMAAFLKRALGE